MSDLQLVQKTIERRIKQFSAGSIIFTSVDGVFSAQFSKLENLPAKIIMPDCSNGIKLNIPKNITFVHPVVFLLIFTDRSSDKVYNFQNSIIIDQSSSVNFLEDYFSIEDVEFTCNVIAQIDLGDGANLEFYKSQNISRNARHNAILNVEQYGNSVLKHCHLHLGSQESQENLVIKFQKGNASCEVSGLYLAKERQNKKINIRVEHLAPNCSSNVFYKGTATDEANASFTGRILVKTGRAAEQSAS